MSLKTFTVDVLRLDKMKQNIWFHSNLYWETKYHNTFSTFSIVYLLKPSYSIDPTFGTTPIPDGYDLKR